MLMLLHHHRLEIPNNHGPDQPTCRGSHITPEWSQSHSLHPKLVTLSEHQSNGKLRILSSAHVEDLIIPSFFQVAGLMWNWTKVPLIRAMKDLGFYCRNIWNCELNRGSDENEVALSKNENRQKSGMLLLICRSSALLHKRNSDAVHIYSDHSIKDDEPCNARSQCSRGAVRLQSNWHRKRSYLSKQQRPVRSARDLQANTNWSFNDIWRKVCSCAAGQR